MEFLYKGGDCDSSDFRRCEGDNPDLCTCEKLSVPRDMWPDKFFCDDFPPGPPAVDDRGVLVWIQANAAGDEEDLYFQGPVAVGDTWNATTTDDKVSANMDIFVYDYDETTGVIGGLLQQILFHSSCSRELYLADTFGGHQLVEFEDQENVFSLFRIQTIDVNLTLAATAGSSMLMLSSFQMVLFPSEPPSIPVQTQNFDVSGTTLPPPLELVANFMVTIANYNVLATIEGELDGQKCSDFFETDFACERVPADGTQVGPGTGGSKD
jgi:hypothetical protein